ncbi:DNA gyrase inhibitor GyrI [Rhizobium mongolense]
MSISTIRISCRRKSCAPSPVRLAGQEPPFERQTIDGGEYAVLRHNGPYADMHKAYQWLYAEWLPKSGRQIKDSVMFEEYLNNPRDVPPTDLLTDIYMPLA